MATFGELVTAEQAENYFDAHAKVKQGSELKRNATDKLTVEQNFSAAIADVYNSSPINAFVFDANLVKKLLNEKDEDGHLPKYLMVHLAAKYKPKEIGTPTIVLLGCNEKSGGKTKQFISMNNASPALETPGLISQPGFPPSKGNKLITFKKQ